MNIVNHINKHHQFVRFVFVGLLNTLFAYMVYSFFIFTGLHYTIAAFLTTCAGIAFNYSTLGKLVFRYNKKISWPVCLKFLTTYAVIYLLNISIIKLISYTTENFYLSGGIAIVVCALLSYKLNRDVVFCVKEPI